MICISVTPESRKFAKVDMLNASRHCGMIELCLDHLVKEPDVGDLLKEVGKPVLVSCRRERDGGQWKGSEEDRIALLRQAIVSGPAYVELELDIAKSIPRFGDTKRVVSYTSLDKPLGKVDDIFTEAADADADVVKFTWPTPNLDAAWPLLVAVSKKRKLPVVGMGLGRASLMFSLMGLKYGSPWIYAALEKGMEAHPGQATVWELEEIHRWGEITPNTRFIGVIGTSDAETVTARVLNTAFDKLYINSRCLPITLGKTDNLEKMLDILKINTLILNPDTGSRLLSLAKHKEEAVDEGSYADLLLKQPDGWHAYNMIWRSLNNSIEKTLGAASEDEHPLDRRSVMIAGSYNVTQAVTYGITRRKSVVSVTAPNDAASQRLAKMFDVRHVLYASMYDTYADVIVVTDSSIEMGTTKAHFNPGYLRENMTAVDITDLPNRTEILREAKERGCRIVEPADILAEQLSGIFKAITGKELPDEVIKESIASD
ncbi:MAG: type I 3-dehydroquinate dehydratase [Planctomycetes bacterium]|nr:type I 3-dehydroquinate dehydratase [Planctomycetota bacterium]